jgi:hypothetical protein
MSGTLLTTGPTDIAHYIYRMTRCGWRDHRVLKVWMNGEAIELGIGWDKLVRTGYVKEEASRMIIERFKPLIETIVLHFTPNSNFLGTGPVVSCLRISIPRSSASIPRNGMRDLISTRKKRIRGMQKGKL